MLRFSILMMRRSNFTYEQFSKYWREVHAPLFAAQSESKKYVRRYVQDHRMDDALQGTTASNFHGIAEIWFDDISGAKAFFESDGYKQNVISMKNRSWTERTESCYTPDNTILWLDFLNFYYHY